ncbi:hypothetical protein KXV77_005855, partial [Aspergillus fumigatus]
SSFHNAGIDIVIIPDTSGSESASLYPTAELQRDFPTARIIRFGCVESQEGTIAAVLDFAEAPQNISEPRATRTAEHKYWELGQHRPQRGSKFVGM